MAQQYPTVIAASLDDSKLRDSITSLVTFVDEQTKKMAQSFNTSMSSIKQSFDDMPNVTQKVRQSNKELVDSFDTVSAAIKRAKSNSIGSYPLSAESIFSGEKKAIDDFNAHFQQGVKKAEEERRKLDEIIAKGRQSAEQSMRPRDRFDVRQDSEIHQLRMTIHGLESDLARLDKASMSQALKQFNELTALITQAREEVQKLKSTPFTDKAQQEAAIQQIQTLEGEIRKLMEARHNIDPTAFNVGQRNDIIQKLEEAKQRVHDLGTEMERVAAIEERAAQAAKEIMANKRGRGKGGEEYYTSSDGKSMLLQFKNEEDLKQQILKIEQQITTERRQQNEVASSSQRRASIDEEIAASRRVIQEQAEMRESFIRTAIASQASSQEIIRSMHQQASDTSLNTPITKTKELEDAILKMERAYWSFSQTERESPIAQSLRRDIEIAKEALKTVQRYNRSLLSNSENQITGNSSLNSLQRQLKDLTNQYKHLTVEELNAGRGDQIIQHFQDVSRAAQIFQKTLSRPISFNDALRGDERTIEEITYKIQRLQSYRSGIDITNPQQAVEMKQVDAELNRLNKDLDKYRYVAENAQKSNNTLTRSWNYMKNRLAFYFTVGATTQFVKQIIDVRAQYEMTERAIGILINSAERGTQIFNELSQMALVSPYTLIELSNAAKQLTAYDVAAKDVVDTTRRLADMSAAVGLPIERLTYALGQIKAYGYLNNRDARMFANAGIPLIQQLSDYYTKLEGRMVSVADVYDRMKKKAIGFNDVMAVVTSMTDEGGKFFNYQAKMAETLKVQLANLTLAWNNMLNDMGRSNQSLISGPIKGLKELFLRWRDIDRVLGTLGWTFFLFKAAQLGALTVFKLWGDEEARQAVLGDRLNKTYKGLATSGVALAHTFGLIVVAAIVDTIRVINQAKEATREFNRSLSEVGKERFDNLNKSFERYNDIIKRLWTWEKQNDGGYKPVATKDLDITEANKVWAQLREEIENTASAGDYFVNKLEDIDNVNDRLRAGFKYLRDIQKVAGAMQEMGENTIKVKQDLSAISNLYLAPEGLIKNLKDYQAEVNNTTGFWDKVFSAKAFQALGSYYGVWKRWDELLSGEHAALEQFREDLEQTTESLINFSIAKNFTPSQESEFVAMANEKILQQGNLDAKAQLTYRIEQEQQYVNARLQLFQDEIDAENKLAERARTQQEKQEHLQNAKRAENEKQTWEQSFGVGRSLWSEFTKYMTRNHSSELNDMFGNMTREEIEHINWSEPKWQNWARKNAKAFSDQFNVSFDDLWKWVKEANNWKIFLKVFIDKGEAQSSIYETLNKLDAEAEKEYSTLTRLNTRIDELKNKSNKTAAEVVELNNAILEAGVAQQKYDEAVAKGGESRSKKSEDKKADKEKNKHANAARKAQREAETELQKAFKDELQLIDKVRSQYTKLTKAGVDGTTAMTMVTTQFKNSIGNINKVLSKNGLPIFDITKFAGTDDPHMVLEMLNKQLQAAKTAKNIKPSEIKDLEIKIGELIVDAKTYNMKKVTDGLNNELSKIKEEYELMVSIDAMPELGDIFTNLFNIDTSKMPKNIEEVVARYQDAINNGLVGALYGGADMDVDDLLAPFDLLTTDLDDWAKKTGVETGSTLYNSLQQAQKQIRDMVEKDKKDTIKQIEELEYKLADVAGKIAIEEEKLERLRQKLAQETNEERRKLLELQIQDQQNAIAKLKEGLIEETMLYKQLFGNLADYSARMTRQIAQQLLDALNDAKRTPLNERGEHTYIDPNTNKVFGIKPKTLENLLSKVNGKMKESQTSFEKIKDALTTGDWVKAIELIAVEAHKVADGVGEIANIAESLGASEETVDTFNAIADSIDGIATASEGVSQIANVDVIGGSVNVIKGLWQSISSWFDRSNKRITRQVKESERAVKQLENAYKNLEYAVEHSMGSAETQARRAALANKRLQITELENQLTLEKSRKKKNQDEDKIRELEGALIDARHELQDLSNDIMNTLLGSDIKSAAEEFVDTWVQAWRAGETTLDAIKEKMDEMVFNLIKKAATSKIVGNLLQPLYNAVDMFTTDSSEGGVAMTTNELKALASLAGQLGVDINEALGAFYGNLENLDIISKSMDNKELSALQQGIQGITEDTASALEAYMNGVSQQVYLHSDLLTQIRDAVVALDGDIQMSVQAQMLLQLQQSYQMQSAIQSIMVGWSNPSGNAVKVELLN